jgi:hypothetical protein
MSWELGASQLSGHLLNSTGPQQLAGSGRSRSIRTQSFEGEPGPERRTGSGSPESLRARDLIVVNGAFSAVFQNSVPVASPHEVESVTE